MIHNISIVIPFLLSLGGIGVCVYILKQKSKGHPLVCPIGSSCNDVIYSKYSKTFGLRNEVGGLLYYLLVLFFYGSLFLGFEVSIKVTALVLLASLMAFMFSLYLVSVMAFVLRKWCVWCLTSATISTLIFIISFVSFLK